MDILYFRFFGQSGYARAAENYVQSLKLANFNTQSVPIDFAKKRQKTDLSIFHCTPDIIKRFQHYKESCIFATFETFDPPKNWLSILNKFQLILAPSLFNQKIFQEALQKEIHYIPHCIDTQRYSPDIQPLYSFDGFNFLFLGTWKKRKGYDLLINPFLTALKEFPEFSLWIKTSDPLKAYEYFLKFTESVSLISGNLNNHNNCSIKIIQDKIPDSVFPFFLKSFDCLVSPTRGEGFGLPGLEAMSIGVPLITTNFSGCQDYANDSNSWLIQPTGFEEIEKMDNLPQFSQKKWPIIEESQIHQMMIKVFKDRQNREDKTENGIALVKEKFSLQTTSKKWSDILCDR